MEYVINPLIIYTFIGLLSLAIGSLLNVIIYRLPLMLQADWVKQCQCLLNIETKPQKNINLFFPRSFCTACKTTIKARHNIPLISFFFLCGQCHSCQHFISRRYPLVEFLCCLLSILATWHFGLSVVLIFSLLFIWFLIVLFFIDFDHQLLPDCLTLSFLWLGLLANSQAIFTSLPDAVYSAAGAYLVLWLFTKLFYFFNGKIGMGNGDFKLFAALGAWFGWIKLPLILLIASLTGLIVGLIYLKIQQKPRDSQIAFGPFLVLAALINLFFGNAILPWYLNLWF